MLAGVGYAPPIQVLMAIRRGNHRHRAAASFDRAVLLDEQELLERELGDSAYSKGHYAQAATLIDELTTAPEFVSFLTTVGYAELGNWPGSE